MFLCLVLQVGKGRTTSAEGQMLSLAAGNDIKSNLQLETAARCLQAYCLVVANHCTWL